MGRSIANLHHCLSSCQGGDVGDQHRFATLRFTRLSRFWPTDHVKRGGTGWDLVSCAARWETQTETYDNIDLITHSHITINQHQSTWCQKIYSDTDWQSILKSTVCICMRSFNSSCLLSFSRCGAQDPLGVTLGGIIGHSCCTTLAVTFSVSKCRSTTSQWHAHSRYITGTSTVFPWSQQRKYNGFVLKRATPHYRCRFPKWSYLQIIHL